MIDVSYVISCGKIFTKLLKTKIDTDSARKDLVMRQLHDVVLVDTIV